jgi:hypothetical protein
MFVYRCVYIYIWSYSFFLTGMYVKKGTETPWPTNIYYMFFEVFLILKNDRLPRQLDWIVALLDSNPGVMNEYIYNECMDLTWSTPVHVGIEISSLWGKNPQLKVPTTFDEMFLFNAAATAPAFSTWRFPKSWRYNNSYRWFTNWTSEL